jgi:hypothetical protein
MNTTSKSSKRIGHRMAALAAYVAANPGCSMLAAAEHVGPHGSRQFGYRTAHRAVRAHVVHAIKGAGRYRLYPIAA